MGKPTTGSTRTKPASTPQSPRTRPRDKPMSMTSDPTASLLAQMERHELQPGSIVWDGEIHRFPGIGKDRGKDGWYIAQPEQHVAHYGSWGRLDTQEWSNGKAKPRTPEQIERAKKDAQRRAREANEAAKRQQEAIEAEWKGAKPASPDHPYLVAKGIEEMPLSSVTIRQSGEALIIAMRFPNKRLVGIQRIRTTDKPKKFARGSRPSGSYGTIPGKKGDTLYVAEGLATAASVNIATGSPVAIAFSAQNLPAVAAAMHEKYPDARIIIAADNDRWTKITLDNEIRPNPGVTYARIAAEEAGAEWCVPDFQDLEDKLTDFNDLHQREGLDAVRKWLDPKMASEAVTTPEPEPEPEPESEPEPEPKANGAEFPGPLPDWQNRHLDKRERKDGRGVDRVITESPEGLLAAARDMGCDLRYNILIETREWWDGFGDNGWQRGSRRKLAKLKVEIERRYKFERTDKKGTTTLVPATFGLTGRFKEYTDFLFHDAPADPMCEYLDSLKWDGKPRLDFVMNRIWGTPQDALTAWASRYVFMTTALRTLEPGAKVDEIPVIIGPPDCGKTIYVYACLPPHLQDRWGKINLRTSKEAMESVQGKLVCEIGEGKWLTKTAIEFIKDFLSQQDDGSDRKAYRLDAMPQLRRCAIVATGDHDHVLPDDHNLRRFVVVKAKRESGKGAVAKFLEKHRDQLWAEAWHRVRNGEPARLPYELKSSAHARAEQHKKIDGPLHSAIRQVVAPTMQSSGFIRMLTVEKGLFERTERITGPPDNEVTEYIPPLLPVRRNPKDVADAMRSLGYVPKLRRHVKGEKPFWAWIRRVE